MIAPLPESQGHEAILVVVDWFSKEIIAIPTQTELTSEGWAREYITHVYTKHGLSRKVISDRSPQFVSKFIRDTYTDSNNPVKMLPKISVQTNTQ